MISFTALFKLVINNLWVHRFRSGLTIIGMIFGSGAVIATLSSNEGAQRFVTSELKSLGANIITAQTSPGTSRSFTTSDIDFIKKYSTLFKSLSLFQNLGIMGFRYQNKIQTFNVLGIDNEYLASSQLEIKTGRPFSKNETLNFDQVVILGAETKKRFFGKDYAVGEHIVLLLNETPILFRVVGVLSEKGGVVGFQWDTSVFFPFGFSAKIKPQVKIASLIGALKDEKKSAIGKAQLKVLFSPVFGNAMVVSDAKETIEKTQKIWQKQNFVGICLACISLLTGGIGIMNVMLLSIQQRRKEIGLRKAVGARNIDICMQFLLEAILVCLFGGIIGIVLGWAFGKQVAQMLGQWEAVTTFGTVALALFFSTLTGVFFGLFPAIRASQLDPYEALRSS